MNDDVVRRAVVLAGRGSAVWIATADGAGNPHVTRAGGLRLGGERQVLARHWFCPHILANLDANPRVSVVVWDEGEDEGYQLLGHVELVAQTAMIDGYSPDDEVSPVPQVEWELRVVVDEALDCCRAPHACREAR